MLTELNQLISVRNFISSYLDNLSINIKPEKASALGKKVILLDKSILNMVLALDVDKVEREASGLGEPIYSTLELKSVEQLDKLVSFADKGKKVVKDATVK